MNSAVERAARYIWAHYSEPLTLADIAQSAGLSRFHLCRVFRADTSVSPCRFLSGVRIFQARQMLLTTPLSVADIAFAVGYGSVGSFANHFSGSVGVPPGLFRWKAQNGGFEFPGRAPYPSPARAVVHGTISLPDGYAGARVYLGAFTTAFVQYQPASGVVVVDVPAGGRPFPYRLPDVPEGTWFIHAVGTAGRRADAGPWTVSTELVGGRGPVSVTAVTPTLAAISLRPRRMTDPPVLLALPAPDSADGRTQCARF